MYEKVERVPLCSIRRLCLSLPPSIWNVQVVRTILVSHNWGLQYRDPVLFFGIQVPVLMQKYRLLVLISKRIVSDLFR
jgi:hypothetical protein